MANIGVRRRGVAHHITHHHTRRASPSSLHLTLAHAEIAKLKEHKEDPPSLECIGASALPPTAAYPTELVVLVMVMAAVEVERRSLCGGGCVVEERS